MKRAPGIVWLIVLVAAALRFYRVAEMPLRADEASSLFLALQDPAAIVRVFLESDPHMPLYFLVLHYWTLAAGISEIAVRLSAIFVGVTTVALTYVLGRQIFPRRCNVAVFGAALIAINPFLIWDAQDVYMYSALTATTLLSFVLFVRVGQPHARWYHWLAYVAANVASCYLHYFFAFILAAQACVWLIGVVTRRIPRRAAIGLVFAQIASGLLFLPWLIAAAPLLTTFHSDFIPPASLLELCQRALVTFTIGRTDTRMAPAWVDPTLGTLLALGFLVVFALGVWARTAAERAGIFGLSVFLGVPVLAFFVYSLVRFPLFDERYVLYVSAIFSLLLANGIAHLFETRAARGLGVLACAFILLADGYALNNYFHVPEFARSPDWHAFMRTVNARAQPGDGVIQNYPDPALPYYLQNRLPRVLLPRTGAATVAEVDADLQRVTNRYARVWFQAAPYSTWDTEGWVAAWLERHARQLDAFEFRGLRLVLYLPITPALQRATPADASFAGQITLLAFEADTARPGVTTRVVLYWQAARRPTQAATGFVHLYDASGRLWSQRDNTPVRGTFPTQDWRAGEIIVDEYDLTIPADAPPGTYTLDAGLYDSQTQERLAATDARGQALPHNRVRLITVEW